MLWEKPLRETIEKHGNLRMNGRVASTATKNRIHQTWHAAFGVLHEKGYKLMHSKNLTDDHLKLIMHTWHAQGKSVRTFQTDLYAFRIILARLNKGSIVKPLAYYLPDLKPSELVVHMNAERSKSWAEHGIDIEAKIKEVDAHDSRFGLMLLLALSFGLRRKELLNCVPAKSTADGKTWRVFANEGKGSRPRLIDIETEHQRTVLQHVLSKLQKNERLSWVGLDNKQAINRYCRLMRKFGLTKVESGVTGHGLRAQYAENAALIALFIPATLSGSNAGMDKNELRNAKIIVSEKLGHSRENITGAYYGSYGRTTVKFEIDHYRRTINDGIQHLIANNMLEKPDPALFAQCAEFCMRLFQCGIPANQSQIQTLWRKYSARYGTDWVQVTGEGEFERGIEVAATMYLRA